VLESLRNSGADLTSPAQQRPPSMIYNGQTGAITITDAGIVTPPARIPDDNRDLAAEHAKLLKLVSDAEAKLDAGTFDQQTGAKRYTITGTAREQLQTQISRMKDSVSLSIESLKAIDAQRRSDALKLAANEQLVRAAVGDAAKQDALSKLIEEEELRTLARSIVRARAVGRR
jgi:hypothetical protein